MPSVPGNAGRKHPVHLSPLEQENRSTIIFLTVCTKGKQPLLANPGCHALLVDWWRKSDHWLAGKYVIMPDHVHLFCAPRLDGPLSKWVAYWKNGVARNRPVKNGMDFWQRDFWDTQMRSEEEYAKRWDYVQANPLRKGLLGAADLWPFSGEIHRLHWRER